MSDGTPFGDKPKFQDYRGFCGAVSLGKFRGLAVRSKLWMTGSTLRVMFLGGSVEFQDRILAIAQEWSQWAFINFVKSTDAESEVRVGFVYGGGFWSYVGKDCLLPELQALQTMNLGWPDENVSGAELQSIVLHEFGHVLGLEHEHRSPQSKIQWDEDAVLSYYMTTQGWTEQYVRSNVLDKVTDPSDSTEFDPDSIMMYPVHPGLTLDGWSAPWGNQTLSEGDRSFIAALYPGRRFSRPLEPSGPPPSGSAKG